ncbi:Translation elongation factor 1 beta [Tulasnella sp. JGI-2019a]|nr:Translation elongation factor 1 beta [Tulasnella sp. JGI-2019a]KAG8995077.1 Translation elongation factor 1 beta [Tulasnella sp. JGI-2019a]KAG9026323.1 Translation elongation factor 1 beta [Tulasnella sp. JGI-2019a]
MYGLERAVRSIEALGLLWGASKLIPIGYSIKKLQITAIVEDELVSVDELQEKCKGFRDLVEGTDVAAVQKL